MARLKDGEELKLSKHQLPLMVKRSSGRGCSSSGDNGRRVHKNNTYVYFKKCLRVNNCFVSPVAADVEEFGVCHEFSLVTRADF